MPTYEYKCVKCNIVFEKFQSITEDSLKKCPECGGKVDRMIGSGAGIIFKGKGFYQTDYKSSCPKTNSGKSSGGDKPACPASSGCACGE